MNKSDSRPPSHAPSSRRPRPGTVGALKESFLRQASEFVPPLLRGSKCIRPLFSSSKGREWNKSKPVEPGLDPPLLSVPEGIDPCLRQSYLFWGLLIGTETIVLVEETVHFKVEQCDLGVIS
eukprot:scaffold360_cov374-Pavlova_lutheri.AAC.28